MGVEMSRTSVSSVPPQTMPEFPCATGYIQTPPLSAFRRPLMSLVPRPPIPTTSTRDDFGEKRHAHWRMARCGVAFVANDMFYFDRKMTSSVELDDPIARVDS